MSKNINASLAGPYKLLVVTEMKVYCMLSITEPFSNKIPLKTWHRWKVFLQTSNIQYEIEKSLLVIL